MTKQMWRLGTLLGAVVLAACGGSNGVAVCSTAGDCASGQSCVSGVCTLGGNDAGATCSFNTDCSTGQTCVSGVCTASSGPAIGSPCTSNAACATGDICILASEGFPGGYCSAACGAHACPTASQCIDLSATPVAEKACAESCNFNSDCRTGYSCCPGFANTCVPAAVCAGHTDGGNNDGGNNNDGGVSDGGNSDGGNSDGGVSDGGNNDGGNSDGGVSDGGNGDGGNNDGGLPSDAGIPTDGGAPGDGGTLACAAPTLTNGGMIGPASQPGSCVKPVLAPTLNPGETVQNLGRTKVGAKVSFFVDAGVGTISIIQQVWDAGAPDTFNITDSSGGAHDFPNYIAPLAVTDPSGNSYMTFDSNFTVSTDPSTLEISQSDFQVGTEALTFPNTTQALSHESGGYPSGTWQFQVGDFAYLCQSGEATFTQWYQGIGGASCSGGSNTSYYDVRVITKQAAGSTGKVDIGLYMVSTNWTAAQAMTDPYWARFISTLQKLYGYQGLCLGSVTFYDVPAWAKTAFASGLSDADASPCGPLYQMMTLSTSANAVNFFFVDSISTSDTAGIDSGNDFAGTQITAGPIPGPLGIGGTEFSGVAIDVSDISASGCGSSVDYVACGADALAFTAAHKTGHQMGLYHPTESQLDSGMNAYFDPIADTPQCDPTNCDANKDGVIQPSECTDDSAATGTCGGGDNLMFWSIDSTSAGNISPQQAKIIRASPAVRSNP